MAQSFKEQIEQLQKDWATNPRWKGVRREYTAEDVVRLRRSLDVQTHERIGHAVSLEAFEPVRRDDDGAREGEALERRPESDRLPG